jgi:hypothetical protein
MTNRFWIKLALTIWGFPCLAGCSHPQPSVPPIGIAIVLVAKPAMDGADIGDFNEIPPLPAGYRLADITSHLFALEAKIKSIQCEGDVLEYMVVEPIRSLPTGVGYDPLSEMGSEVVVHFNARLPGFASLGLCPGTVITLFYGNAEGPNWVSSLAWVRFWRDQQWYVIEPANAGAAATTMLR